MLNQFFVLLRSSFQALCARNTGLGKPLLGKVFKMEWMSITFSILKVLSIPVHGRCFSPSHERPGQHRQPQDA